MTAKRIVVHFEDETGTPIVSQLRKHKPAIGDLALLNGTAYAIAWRRDSSTSVDFGARPERRPVVDMDMDGIVHG